MRQRFASPNEIARLYWAGRLSRGTMTAATAARYLRVFDAFCRFVDAHGLASFTEADRQLCARFVHAPRRAGAQVATSTSRFRLTVIRDAYAAVAELTGGVDPTAGLRVAQDPQVRLPEPLSPAEVARLRSAGRIMPRDHLRPTLIELALVGGSHTEIASVAVADLDPAVGRVRLGARWNALDGFAIATLSSRIAACRAVAKRRSEAWIPSAVSLAMPRPLSTYPRASIAPGISSGLSRAMKAAGLTRPGLRPASLREYAANRQYAHTARVEDVAELLGLTSLDVARGFISDEWQARYADEVRA